MTTTYFTDKTYRFMRALARNNNRDWFHAHKADYEAHLRVPFLRLIGDLQQPLAAISAHFRADPRPVGGSLFRIHRDTRYAHDKTPYKTWGGARLFHERRKQVPAPSFYLHIQPGQCFIGGGLWHPETPVQRRVRDFIVENPESWKQAVHTPTFKRQFDLDDTSLVRPPRGYPADHALIEDLKRKNFVATHAIDDAVALGPQLLPAVVAGLRGCAPLIDYLCAALDLEF